MSEEIKNENWMQGSEVANDFVKHMSAMAQVKGLPVGMSFAVPLEGFQAPLLVDLAIDASKGGLCFVVIEHEHVFEVQRLEDGSSWKLFYKYNRPRHESKQIPANHTDLIKAICGQYLEKPFASFSRYDSNLTEAMKADRVISYAVFQRRLASVAVFRKSREGSSASLKRAIEDLIDSGFLRRLVEEEQETFKTSAQLFEIMSES